MIRSRAASRLVLLAVGYLVALTAGVLAQDERPPEGAAITGTPPTAQGAWKEKFLKHPDGFWFRYYELGASGPPVILLHGLGSTGFANWLNVGIAPALAETNKVYVPDMRYAGRPAGSPALPSPGRMNNNDNATDVLFFMDALGIKQAHIGGYSMGGGTTAFLMQRAPERFITAHFGGSGPRETPEFIDKVIPDPRPPADPNAGARRGRGPGGDDKGGGGADAKGRGDEKGAADGRGGRGGDRGGGGGLYPGGGPPTMYAGDLKTIKFPVLSVIGEFDAPNYVTHRLYRELDDFHRVILAGRQHITAVRDPKYIEVLRGFIVSNNPR